MKSTWTDSRLDDLNGRVKEIRDDVRIWAARYATYAVRSAP